MREIAQHISNAMSEGEDLVLVTIVGSKGSTPRNAGSQMVVSHDGLVCGTIGGGAMEAHAIDEAQSFLGQSRCHLEDMALRQQAVRGLDMPCGGDASVLFTPICSSDAAWREVADQLLRCFDQRIPACLALACVQGRPSFESRVALVGSDGHIMAGDVNVPAGSIAGMTQQCLVGDNFVLPVPLPTRAIVFGGGHVGRATVAALSQVGFACTVFDCRPEFAQAARFPDAQAVVLGDYCNIAASLQLDERDYVIIMTHGHQFDNVVLEQALRLPLAYVGFMGSKRKIAAARKYVLEAGALPQRVDAVHMPIGLDIKAETPREIAVSVAAECILHRATR